MSGGWAPEIDLISVDLPAPLSPTRATTSPGWTSRSTSLSASTGPKLFVKPFSARRGCDRNRPRTAAAVLWL